MEKLKIVLKLMIVAILGLFIYTNNNREIEVDGIGKTLDHLTDIPVLFVHDIHEPFEAPGITHENLIFRYTLHPTNPDFKWNGQDVSNAPRGLTNPWNRNGAIQLQLGDRITYINKFNQLVTLEATSFIPDFAIVKTYGNGDSDPNKIFYIGNQVLSNPTADIKITIENETKPTYVSLTNLDYGDYVMLKKADIKRILVKDVNDITYSENGDYIEFHGKKR